MKYLPYYIPFFGPILLHIEVDWKTFDYKNPHYWATGLFHGIIWGAIFAG